MRRSSRHRNAHESGPFAASSLPTKPLLLLGLSHSSEAFPHSGSLPRRPPPQRSHAPQHSTPKSPLKIVENRPKTDAKRPSSSSVSRAQRSMLQRSLFPIVLTRTGARNIPDPPRDIFRALAARDARTLTADFENFQKVATKTCSGGKDAQWRADRSLGSTAFGL